MRVMPNLGAPCIHNFVGGSATFLLVQYPVAVMMIEKPGFPGSGIAVRLFHSMSGLSDTLTWLPTGGVAVNH